jgi:hypothetical protein
LHGSTPGMHILFIFRCRSRYLSNPRRERLSLRGTSL